MKRHFILATTLLIFFSSCSVNPYAPTNKMYKKQARTLAKTISKSPLPFIEGPGVKTAPYFVGTVNFNLRKPNYVIIHHTAQNACEQTLKTFTTVKTQVSAHYVICKDGTIYHMLNDYLRAWHGGNAKWGSLTDINSSSIGIELDNNGFEAFTDTQINSLLSLLAMLKKNYNIPASNFIGHSDIAPKRKVDPNPLFPWKKLASKGFGLWYDDMTEVPDSTFNSKTALRLIGYDVQDSIAAIKAFKLHFIQTELSPQLTDFDKSVLDNLSKKY
ncbi:N-acetylmuramoyl-L-alanine amidase [Rubrolithibacter danxiaensis]|uniref:N-acetylmuramoyl-L-alanine amidase n=1 Tax=Rubrolithibacter danxiaensis TaxID=3390805 RepID=UPI003BF77541